MTARAKFLFDTDFGQGDGARAAMSAAQQQAAMAEAEARGYRNGAAAGRMEVTAEAERRMAAALEHAASSFEQLAQGLEAVEAKLEAEAVEVAAAVARKLAPALIAREPVAEIAALAADCFRHLVNAPHVVVRLNEALADAARVQLGAIAERCSFDGRLIVLSEPDMAPGDCRVEWADGGTVRDRAAVEAAIAEAVERYVAVRRASDDTGFLE
jgi:flagellar assembly protein FliH